MPAKRNLDSGMSRDDEKHLSLTLYESIKPANRPTGESDSLRGSTH
jgi:hypothetical protein